MARLSWCLRPEARELSLSSQFLRASPSESGAFLEQADEESSGHRRHRRLLLSGRWHLLAGLGSVVRCMKRIEAFRLLRKPSFVVGTDHSAVFVHASLRQRLPIRLRSLPK